MGRWRKLTWHHGLTKGAPKPSMPGRAISCERQVRNVTGANSSASNSLSVVDTTLVEDWLAELGRRVQEQDLTSERSAAALIWLKGYEGNFGWLVDHKARLERFGSLFPSSLAGVLNCWRADLLSTRRRQSTRARTPALEVDVHSMPTGCYAVRHADGHIVFYRIVRGRDRWADYSFLNQVVGGGRLHYLGKVAPGQLYRGRRRADLTLIAGDPEAASRLFGQELGVCGVCGKILTDDRSRRAGLGPTCARKWQRRRLNGRGVLVRRPAPLESRR